jgi:hypothetical protein
MAPGVDSTSNRNEYQEYFLRGKGGRWQPYQLHVPIVLKSGSLNLLEPSDTIQDCTGTALPLPFTVELGCSVHSMHHYVYLFEKPYTIVVVNHVHCIIITVGLLTDQIVPLIASGMMD